MNDSLLSMGFIHTLVLMVFPTLQTFPNDGKREGIIRTQYKDHDMTVKVIQCFNSGALTYFLLARFFNYKPVEHCKCSKGQ